jgi:phage shock protein C
MPRRLYRSNKDRFLAGVCGGLAEYFDTDPLLMRIIFILLTLSGGLGILLYLIAWLIIPPKPSTTQAEEPPHMNSGQNENRKGKRTGMLLGTFLIVLGIGFLLHNYGLFHLKFSVIWPLILIAIGIKLIIGNKK